MRCPDCKNENLEGARFCSFCSKKMPQVVLCPSCRAENIEGAKFCSACAWRMDQSKPFSAGPGGPPAPTRQTVIAGIPADATEPETATVSASTSFCHVCHEPIPTSEMYLDVDGNKMCKKCMMSGGKKKDPRERAIEQLKQKMEGPSAKIGSRAPVKTKLLKLKDEVEAEQRGRPVLLIALVLFLALLGGGGAAVYFTGNHVRLMNAVGIGQPQAPEPGPEQGGGKPAETTGEKSGTPPKKTPEEDLPAKADSRIYIGAYKGLDSPDGRHPGAMMFESSTGEALWVILPSGMESTASTYEAGKRYIVKFKPDDEYQTAKRVTFEMLEEPIREWN